MVLVGFSGKSFWPHFDLLKPCINRFEVEGKRHLLGCLIRSKTSFRFSAHKCGVAILLGLNLDVIGFQISQAYLALK